MENVKQKIVLPTRGVCNTTPDPICEDSEMEDCVGLTFSDDAVRPIQDVEKMLDDVEGTLMFAHRLNDGETVNYISSTGTDIRWGSEGCVDIGFAVTSVKSVGNTLLVNTNNGIYYLLWYNGTYKNIGNKIPEPELYFSMHTYGVNTASYHAPFGTTDYQTNACDVESLYTHGDGAVIKVEKKNIEAFYDGVAAAYAKNKNDIAEKKMFHSPFFLCYAFELYDGTYAKASNPILMLPSTTRSSYFMKAGNGNILICLTHCASLQYWLLYDFSPWKDIVKNITVFASPQIEQFNTKPNYPTTQDYYYFAYDSLNFEGIIEGKFYDFTISSVENIRAIYDTMLPLRDKSEVIRDLVETGLFYKIAEIKSATTDPLHTAWEFLPIADNSVLRTLVTQTRLEPMEYFSHCSFTATGIETFNRRMNMYGINRSFFEGFKSFMPLSDTELPRSFLFKWFYTVEVTILIDGEENIVRYSFNTIDSFCNRMWYYYPDPRAKHVKITNLTGRTILDEDLAEHKKLNGAYYFSDFITSQNTEQHGEGEESTTLPAPENLNNYLLQSEVDNPFVINASGYVRVGQGTILGMAALTTALSQDAYKVATTIVFTTQGIWALEIDSTGVYKAVTPPFSREVCSNPKSITMVDHGVFYVSKKGLMQISDVSNGCVSTQLCGKNAKDYDSFIDFVQDCTMAYDYRDSQLWLTNEAYDYHWVYNMKSGTLSRNTDGRVYKAIVSDYPDTLLQSGSDVYTMYNEPNINVDGNSYNGTFTTRPMKFEQAMALKSLRDLKHIKDMNPEATITLTIYASNDCNTWQALTSVKGRGFKYFKFRYDFENLKATDAFCGTILYYTTRLTDRLR